MIIPVCVVCVFCFPNNFISFGVVAIVCAPLTSGTWCAPVTPGPTRNRSSSFSFLFCCICNWRWILSLCVWLFFIRQEKKAEKLWTCRIVFDCERRRKFLFLGGPFFCSWSMNGMEWRKELLLLLHFLLFFHLLPTRLFFFFISFFFIYSPSSSCNVKSHGSLHTHTHRVDGYGTH